MTPEDNLEKYFKNVLNGDGSISEEDWSIPSDDLWESAKVHFPKKQKKDRALFFWLGLGIFCLLIGAGVASLMTYKLNEKSAVAHTDSKLENIPLKENNKTNQILGAINTEKVIEPTEKEKAPHALNNQAKVNNITKQKKDIPPTKRTENELDIISLQSIEKMESKKPKEPLPNEGKAEQILKLTSLDRPRLSTKVASLDQLERSIAFLEIPERLLNIQDLPMPLIDPITPAYKRWEIGLSYAPFVVIQESILNKGLESNFEEAHIGVKHQNINFSIRRFIHQRFSVSSGLYLSKGAIDLAFCDSKIYDNNTATLGYFLKTLDTPNEINVADWGLDLDTSVEFLADANLKTGDELTIKTGIPFKLKFVQIPVLLNAHFGKRKLKTLVHAGFSLDYQHAKANEFRLDLFKGTDLISKPLVVDPLNEHRLKLRWQAGFGFRYAIKDFLQIGTGIHINISEPILSRYDFGVYYGF